MKKFLSVLAILAVVGTFAFAQEAEVVSAEVEAPVVEEAAAPVAEESAAAPFVSFTNTIKTPIVQIGADGSVKFAGAYEEMEAIYGSEKLDIYAKGRVQLTQTDSGFVTGFGYDASETYFGINFKPGYGFSVGIGQDVVIPGAYLFVEDDNVNLGEIASSGLTLGYAGHGITTCATFDFMSSDNKDFLDANGNYNFKTGFGAFYTYEKKTSPVAFTAGASFLFDAFDTVYKYRAGAYGSIKWEDLDVRAGYSYNTEDDLYIDGDIINLSAYYEMDKVPVYFAGDYITNFANEFYFGLACGYTYKSRMSIDVFTQATTTYTDFAGGEYGVGAALSYKTKNFGTFKCECDVSIADGLFAGMKFPTKWVYSF